MNSHSYIQLTDDSTDETNHLVISPIPSGKKMTRSQNFFQPKNLKSMDENQGVQVVESKEKAAIIPSGSAVVRIGNLTDVAWNKTRNGEDYIDPYEKKITLFVSSEEELQKVIFHLDKKSYLPFRYHVHSGDNSNKYMHISIYAYRAMDFKVEITLKNKTHFTVNTYWSFIHECSFIDITDPQNNGNYNANVKDEDKYPRMVMGPKNRNNACCIL